MRDCSQCLCSYYNYSCNNSSGYYNDTADHHDNGSHDDDAGCHDDEPTRNIHYAKYVNVRIVLTLPSRFHHFRSVQWIATSLQNRYTMEVEVRGVTLVYDVYP